MAGPLAGIRVVELGVWVAGPAAAGILADWGADVVKIEPPTGDPARGFGRMLGVEDGANPPFEMDNRNKRSIVLDITDAGDRDIALQLICGADIFVTNVRPGALDRLGLDFATVAARNDRLVYGLITGYGEGGPDADRAAYDVAAFWSRAGLAHLLTRPGDTPPFQRGGMGDHTAGMTMAGALCAALVARTRTGTGQLVTTSLYRQGAYTVSFDLNTFLMTGSQIAIGQRETMGNPCMNNYAAADGRRFWIVGLQGERHWPALCRAVGRTEWLTDDRFAGPRARAVNARELIALLDEIFAARPLSEWAGVFDREPDFFWSPINTLDDVLADEQFHAAGGIVTVPQGESAVPMVATPVDFHGTPAQMRRSAPELGEHSAAIRAELEA
ncbi:MULTISPECIES: CaiB/BaiF CoA-transferase family protein [Mycobacteriaceae]|uniref:CaiB/BaiF CoA transferase family protein n=1 Tax=Mycobacteriaceae TaxID=1762 RepID=UPI0007FCCCB7|nr:MULTISPECIES: CoA transferase [Mycobacteriaceae]MCK0177412.1 CoA transferase [Mycolicibacterium sp. F2034L]OBB58400.1 CoA-transferase [Mycobacterium sp. 852013-51886_SCH5428379]